MLLTFACQYYNQSGVIITDFGSTTTLVTTPQVPSPNPPKPPTTGGNPAVVVSPTTLPTIAANTAYSTTLTASGGSGSGYTFALTGILPGGMALSSAGVLSGTPPPVSNAPNTFTFTVTATDSLGIAGSQTYAVVVNAAIVISPSNLPNAHIGTPYSQALAAAGGSGKGYVFTAFGALPPGLSLSMAGVISGTPRRPAGINPQTVYNFTITATDSIGATGTLATSITSS